MFLQWFEGVVEQYWILEIPGPIPIAHHPRTANAFTVILIEIVIITITIITTIALSLSPSSCYNDHYPLPVLIPLLMFYRGIAIIWKGSRKWQFHAINTGEDFPNQSGTRFQWSGWHAEMTNSRLEPSSHWGFPPALLFPPCTFPCMICSTLFPLIIPTTLHFHSSPS